VSFSASETKTLIDGDPAAEKQAERGIRTKLAALGQPGIEPVLGRNLRALIDRRDSGRIPRPRRMRVASSSTSG